MFCVGPALVSIKFDSGIIESNQLYGAKLDGPHTVPAVGRNVEHDQSVTLVSPRKLLQAESSTVMGRLWLVRFLWHVANNG